MKRMVILLALSAVLAGILLSRSSTPAAAPAPSTEPAAVPPATAAPQPEPSRPAVQRTIAVTDANGLPRTVRTAASTDVVLMATWCPYSEELKGFLTDPAVRPRLANRRLVFLFEASEWPRLQRRMVDDQGVSVEEAEAAIAEYRRQRGGSPFADERFLQGLPGEIYFVESADELGLSGFPSFYSERTARFDLSRSTWAMQRLGMPRELVRELLDKHAVR